MTSKPTKDESGNSPEADIRPQEKPPKDAAGGGTVILGEGWYHHIKKGRERQARGKNV